MKKLIGFSLVLCSVGLFAQGPFSPPAGLPGSDAIHKDSTAFVSWASNCTLNRGFMQITQPSLGKVTVGDSSMALGKAGSNGVVSLGDGGSATLSFEGKLFNGPGPDFAIFENGFDEYFLELAFVEVSSDGINFYRFPAESLTDTTHQVGSFDSLDASNLNNLAGKYRGDYGVPFDLDLLKNEAGLDVDEISHVRIVDVIGCMNQTHASRDSHHRKVNDPYPTPFPSGGFDLDAVGAIHFHSNGLNELKGNAFHFYPNPVLQEMHVDQHLNNADFLVYNLVGKVVLSGAVQEQEIDLSQLSTGFYVIHLRKGSQVFTAKIQRL